MPAATSPALPGQTAQALLDAFDQDVIAAHAGVLLPADGDPTPDQKAALEVAQKELVTAAVAPFHRPEVRDYIDTVRRNHEQIIDNVNLDTVLFAGYDVSQEETARRIIDTFREFIRKNQDEITALRIIYDTVQLREGEQRKNVGLCRSWSGSPHELWPFSVKRKVG